MRCSFDLHCSFATAQLNFFSVCDKVTPKKTPNDDDDDDRGSSFRTTLMDED